MAQKEFYNFFLNQLDLIGLELSDRQLQDFFKYYEMLIEKNKVMNLTAITEMEDVINKHFVDSLLLIKAISNVNKYPYRLIDVGTGGGFPGIPLKIAFPNLEIVLLDSLRKRIGFLNEVIEQLTLSGIKACHGRAEDYARKSDYREYFDLVVSRAVANLSTLSEYCLPFVKLGGYFVSYKSGNVDRELEGGNNAFKCLGGLLDRKIIFDIPGTNISRTMIVVKKKYSTSKRYPRKAGLPAKEPIV